MGRRQERRPKDRARFRPTRPEQTPTVVAGPLYATRNLQFQGSLSVSNRALINAQGWLHTRGTATWSVPGGAVIEALEFVNSGRVRLELAVSGGLTVYSSVAAAPFVVNEPGGELEIRGGTALLTDAFGPDARVVNAGILRGFAAPGVTKRVVTRALENRGLIEVTGDVLELSNLEHLGRLTVGVGTTTSLVGAISSRPRFTRESSIAGPGDVAIDLRPGSEGSLLERLAGTVELGGAGLGTIRVANGTWGSGEYTQAGTGRLVMDLAGPTASDRLNVHQATLGGTLEVRLAPGYLPALGNEFVLIEASHVTGTFADAVLPGLPPGRRFEIRYDATSVRLGVVPGP